jgi:DNA-binding GntR family transcriptional regulator
MGRAGFIVLLSLQSRYLAVSRITSADCGKLWNNVPTGGEPMIERETVLRTVSTPEAIASALRSMILDGALEPGRRLRETEFAERLGVARHSFRAATQILIAEGLLRRVPNRGVQVPILELEDIRDIFRIRAALELEAVRIVIAEHWPIDIAAQAVAELSALPDSASWRSVVEPDMRFHRAIIDATRSKRLGHSYAAVQSEIELCMVRLQPHYRRPEEVAIEHRELIEPILNGDSAEAVRRFRDHLDDAERNLTSAFERFTEAGASSAHEVS